MSFGSQNQQLTRKVCLTYTQGYHTFIFHFSPSLMDSNGGISFKLHVCICIYRLPSQKVTESNIRPEHGWLEDEWGAVCKVRLPGKCCVCFRECLVTLDLLETANINRSRGFGVLGTGHGALSIRRGMDFRWKMVQLWLPKLWHGHHPVRAQS